MKFQFNRSYFLLFLLLFVTEVLIALYVHDNFIRPWFGDFLVVILLYCTVRSFIAVTVQVAAVAVLLLSYIIEASQYFHLDQLLGLGDSTIAHMVIGQSFSWMDMLAYTLGVLFVIGIENFRNTLK